MAAENNEIRFVSAPLNADADRVSLSSAIE